MRNHAEYGIRIRVAASQEYMNTSSTHSAAALRIGSFFSRSYSEPPSLHTSHVYLRNI